MLTDNGQQTSFTFFKSTNVIHIFRILGFQNSKVQIIRCLTITIKSSFEDKGNESLFLKLLVGRASIVKCFKRMLLIGLFCDFFCDPRSRNDGNGNEFCSSGRIEFVFVVSR